MIDSQSPEETQHLAAGDTRLARNPPPGQDLRLSYRSEIDGTDQPYALYVPAGYDEGRTWPLVVNLHGTSAGMGKEMVGQTSKNYSADRNALFLWAAERHGAILATPFGRGVTEFRGIGDNDVFCVLADVQQRYRVDPERIALTGLSMGGTGSFELGLDHPGVFSAVAPIGAAHSFHWLAANGEHTPFWCIGGEFDRDFVKNGGLECAEKMIELGFDCRLDVLKTREHSDFVPEFFDNVVEWLVQHRVARHPTEYSSSTLLPMFGRAYWTAIDAIESPGTIGTARAQMVDANRIAIETDNIVAVTVLPDPELSDLTRPISVEVDGTDAFDGVVKADQEVQFVREDARWLATLAPRREISLTGYRNNPVADAPEELTMEGVEAALAIWIADAMRAATGADVAMYNRRYYRGLPIPRGVVDEVDLLQCTRPANQELAVAELTGGEIIRILEDNVDVPDTLRHSFPLTFGGENLEFLVQPSGFSYSFDRARPYGQRVVECDIDESRLYRVALEGQVPERAEVWRRATMRLADLYPLRYERTDVPVVGALYAHALRTGRIEAPMGGKVREAWG